MPLVFCFYISRPGYLFNAPFNCAQRLRLYAVRDCGLQTCPPTPKFERGRMLELPLKPLLHIAFVTAWCSLFSVIFLSICYAVSVCRALALVALLQFLVCELACANCKCATKCVGLCCSIILFKNVKKCFHFCIIPFCRKSCNVKSEHEFNVFLRKVIAIN